MLTKEEKIRLGSNELKLLFTLEEEDKMVFATSDVHRILQTSDSSVKNVLYRLKKKGRIAEIERGKYLLVPAKAGYLGSWSEVPFVIVSSLINPYYIGFWSALNYWKMTEQVPRTVFVATTKRKKNLEYGQTKFEFVTLSKDKFFGFVEQEIADSKFLVSSREKTILDCLMYPRYCGGLDEAVKGIWNGRKEIDFAKTLDLAKRLGISAVIRRLGYILEVLNLEKQIREEIASTKKFTDYRWLDPLAPKRLEKSGYSPKYGLMLNRTIEDLTSWMGH
jgi:predicted transcriptional regulator of viral defense system